MKQYLLMTSERQFFFIYSKRGYIFNKGKLAGKLVKDVYKSNGEELEVYLEELFYNEMSSFHTKWVINDIMKDLGLKIFKLR
jgi:hypothetical protein